MGLIYFFTIAAFPGWVKAVFMPFLILSTHHPVQSREIRALRSALDRAALLAAIKLFTREIEGMSNCLEGSERANFSSLTYGTHSTKLPTHPSHASQHEIKSD